MYASTDLEILAANEHTAWTAILVVTEGTKSTLACASSGVPAQALAFLRAQAEYIPDARIYQRTKRNTWRKRAV